MKRVAIIVEIVGIAVTSCGILLEVTLGGEIYFFPITFGALLIAVGGMIYAKTEFTRRRRP